MNIIKPKSGKKEPKQYINQNPFEQLAGIGKGVRDSAVEELGRAGVHDAWEQLLRPGEEHNHKKGGELHPGQELDLHEAKHETHSVTQMGHEFMEEILEAGENADKEESKELQVKYQEILIELRELGKSSKELKAQV